MSKIEVIENTSIETEQMRFLYKKHSQNQLSQATTGRNISMVVNIFLAIALILAVMGWSTAADRFANNVRIAWVKLSENGTSKVEFYNDGNAGNRWYQSVIQSSLINYATHRFNMKKKTISGDYGFSLQFLSDAEKQIFLNEYNAIKVAADFTDNTNANEIFTKVRAINHEKFMISENPNVERIYKSTLYLALSEKTKDGVLIKKINKLVHIKWRLMPVEQIAKNYQILQANPLGIEILEQSISNDLIRD